ncbi:MAG: acetylornithine transaminase [Burkholderiales bacterium]|jgi:acetylornithine/N-succinyldiaminopimelate aminotransferase|nr:acetylornithine transaminase [Burkholderiales bacterium]
MNFDPHETHALMDIAARPAQVFVAGRGSWLVDRAGRRYLDFVQGWAVNALGHCPPQIAQALAAQSQQLVSAGPGLFNAPAAALAARLAELSSLERVFLCSGGAEANEGAIKLARKWGQVQRGGAYEIVTFVDAFHGRTLATMSASGKPGWDVLFAPQVPGFPKARLNDLASVEAALTQQTVAVMLEPIQGEAGVNVADDDFLRALRRLCDERGLLLVFDEIQTGVGRTGLLFGAQHAGVRPDIMTLGKGLGGGVPLAAVLAREEVAAAFAHGDQGGTYCGNPLMAAVGSAVLQTVAAPVFLAGVRERGEYLSRRLSDLAATRGLPGERGRGLLRALNLGRPVAAQVAAAALALQPEGLLVNAPRPHLLRFMPALNVSFDEIDLMVDMLAEVLEQAG